MLDRFISLCHSSYFVPLFFAASSFLAVSFTNTLSSFITQLQGRNSLPKLLDRSLQNLGKDKNPFKDIYTFLKIPPSQELPLLISQIAIILTCKKKLPLEGAIPDLQKKHILSLLKPQAEHPDLSIKTVDLSTKILDTNTAIIESSDIEDSESSDIEDSDIEDSESSDIEDSESSSSSDKEARGLALPEFLLQLLLCNAQSWIHDKSEASNQIEGALIEKVNCGLKKFDVNKTVTLQLPIIYTLECFFNKNSPKNKLIDLWGTFRTYVWGSAGECCHALHYIFYFMIKLSSSIEDKQTLFALLNGPCGRDTIISSLWNRLVEQNKAKKNSDEKKQFLVFDFVDIFTFLKEKNKKNTSFFLVLIFINSLLLNIHLIPSQKEHILKKVDSFIENPCFTEKDSQELDCNTRILFESIKNYKKLMFLEEENSSHSTSLFNTCKLDSLPECEFLQHQLSLSLLLDKKNRETHWEFLEKAVKKGLKNSEKLISVFYKNRLYFPSFSEKEKEMYAERIIVLMKKNPEFFFTLPTLAVPPKGSFIGKEILTTHTYLGKIFDTMHQEICKNNGFTPFHQQASLFFCLSTGSFEKIPYYLFPYLGRDAKRILWHLIGAIFLAAIYLLRKSRA